jgi:hypothetical protein
MRWSRCASAAVKGSRRFSIDGASGVPTLYVSRPGSSMVPGIMEFMNPYYRHFAFALPCFLRLH